MIRNLLKDSIVYGISKYLSVFAAIFLMPLYTRLLSKEDYGIMEIINSWNNLIIILLPLGLSSSLIRFYPDIKDSDLEKRKYIGTTLITLLALSILYSVIMIIVKPYLIKSLTDTSAIDEIYYHSILIGVLAIFLTYFLTLLQAQMRKIHYLIISITNLGILVTLGFVFVYNNGMGIVGFYRASSLAYFVALCISIFFAFSDISIRFSRKTLVTILTYSVHLLSVGLLFSAVNLLDRYIIAKFGSISEVGIYSIGVKISGIMGLVIASFALAWFPVSMRIKDDPEAKNIYRKIHDFYFTAVTILLSALILFRRELVDIFAPGYEGTYNVIAILGTYVIINGSIYFYSLGIHIKKQTKFLTVSAIASILVNIVTSILLVRPLGIDGVALGTLAGAIVWVIIQLYYSNKLFPIQYNTRVLINSFAFLLTVFLVVGFYLDHAIDFHIAINLLLKTGIMLFLSFVIVQLFLGKKKLHEIVSLLKKFRSKSAE